MGTFHFPYISKNPNNVLDPAYLLNAQQRHSVQPALPVLMVLGSKSIQQRTRGEDWSNLLRLFFEAGKFCGLL
jgi:hypothetical protein